MNKKELKKLISAGEDGTHQFKANIHNGDSLASEMVSFSNSEGGILFLGVADNGSTPGLSKKDVARINQLISNTASQQVRSPITIQTENVLLENNRIVIVLTVPKGIDKPYFDKNGVIWLKCGSDKRRVNSKEELRRLFQSVDQFHADEMPTKAGLNALDKNRLKRFVQKTYNHSLPQSNAKLATLLTNMNLFNEEGFLNLAGLLLFAEHPEWAKPTFVVKAVCFPGTNIAADKYLDSEDFAGPMEEMFKETMAFIKRNIHKIQKSQGINTLGIPEIPVIVFEELLVNALIHRDYFVNAPIRVLVFTDRIEIVSPGHLPNNLTVEKIIAGNSNIRNPILTSFIAKGLLPYRGLGSGIKRALDLWSEIEFSDDHEGCLFTVSIYRKELKGANVLDKGALKGRSKTKKAPINAPLSALQVHILETIKEDSKISYEEIATKMGKDRSTIRRNIQHLKTKNILRRAGSKKTGFWEILI